LYYWCDNPFGASFLQIPELLTYIRQLELPDILVIVYFERPLVGAGLNI
jgi:hypothetical protein